MKTGESANTKLPVPVSLLILLANSVEVIVGKSATTNALNVGTVADPLAGPANIVLAGCVVNTAVKVPDVVTEALVIVNIFGNARPTDTTEPPPVPPPTALITPLAHTIEVPSAFTIPAVVEGALLVSDAISALKTPASIANPLPTLIPPNTLAVAVGNVYGLGILVCTHSPL